VARLRQGFALLLLLAAHWVNLGVFVLLVPVVLCRPRRLRATILLAMAGCVGIVLAHLAPPPHTTTALGSPSGWMGGWLQLLRNASTAYASWTVLVMVVVSILALVRLSMNGRAHGPVAMAGLALTVAIVNWLFVGTSEWVRLNLYYPRYMFPSLMMVTLGVATLAVAAGRLLASREAVGAVSVASLILVMVALNPIPSLRKIEQGLDARFGQMSADVVSSGATVIAGDYWTVWPAVFSANVSSYRAGARRQVFGLTYRSEPTEILWRVPGTRTLVAGSPKDATVRQTAERHDVHLTLIEHKQSIDLFEGVPVIP
jgi:hypothetical protein